MANLVMLLPFNRISPESTGKKPDNKCIKVVLPAPLGPIKACISPGATLRQTLLLAISEPYVLTTFLLSKTGVLFMLIPAYYCLVQIYGVRLWSKLTQNHWVPKTIQIVKVCPWAYARTR